MRIVLDANQIADLTKAVENDPSIAKDRAIVLPARVWAEILLSPYWERRLTALKRFNLVFGLDVRTIYRQLAILTKDEICVFDPIIAQDSFEHQCHLMNLERPTEEMLKEAKQIKTDSEEWGCEIKEKLRGFRKQNLDAHSRGETIQGRCYETIADVIGELGNGADSPMAKSLIDGVTKNGTILLRAGSPKVFFDAVLKNPRLSRFLRFIWAVHLGYAHAWSDDCLNIDPTENRNDLTDMTLAIHPDDGDVILTADRKFKMIFRHIDAEHRIFLKDFNNDKETIGSLWKI
jgi:hypothetical protein